MNDFDYARMIEIPVSTCDVVAKKQKRLWFKRPEALKQELIETVNGEDAVMDGDEADEQPLFKDFVGSVEITSVADEKKNRRGAFFKRFRPDIVTAQIAVVIVLALTVMLTNIFWKDSGINTLIRSAFAGEAKEEVVEMGYSEFIAHSPSRSGAVSVEEGVMSFSSGGSIYPVCDGKITKVAENAGKYDISIQYSTSFSALISGADYAYYGQGDTVYSSVPVCYSESGEVKVYLYNDGKLLTDYAVDNGKIVWLS